MAAKNSLTHRKILSKQKNIQTNSEVQVPVVIQQPEPVTQQTVKAPDKNFR